MTPVNELTHQTQLHNDAMGLGFSAQATNTLGRAFLNSALE
jgi:hypothetical protein